MKKESSIKLIISNPDLPEQKPQREKEKPTEPNRQIPERVPQRPREQPTKPQVENKIITQNILQLS